MNTKFLLPAFLLLSSTAQAQWIYWYPRQGHIPPPTNAQVYALRLQGLEAQEAYRIRRAEIEIARLNAPLDRAMQIGVYKEREKYLRDKGYLPEIPTRKFVAYGKDYGSFENFKNSPEYQLAVEEGNAREREYNKKKLAEKQRYFYAVQRSREINAMSWPEKYSSENKNAVADSLERDIISGRYSPEETRKLMALWKKL